MKDNKARDINELISEESLKRDSEKRLLETEVLHRSHKLQNFDRFKYDLTKKGEDHEAAFKRLSAERREFTEKLRAYPTPAKIANTLASRMELAAPRFGHAGEGAFVFGAEGCVAAPRASDGISVAPTHNSAPHGRIQTRELGFLGNISFGSEGTEFGFLETTGDSLSEHIWLHNWRYTVLFPCISTASYLTYKFEVGVEAQLFSEADGMIMSFVSIGEEPSASPTSNIPVNIDGGWPLIADLNDPGPAYNGHYGFINGSVKVERTFSVGAGRTPAIAIVVGFVARLTSGHLRLQFSNFSSIGIGQVCYRYTPIPILTQA
ncbi:MAG TPA: hypothetical protein VGO50_00245 [Pyrinomonadaceae bacterium]|jgi:hypothetical protein|nr:hypothetical protein [Pyrinomonadaceae bacterium]